MFWVLKHYLLCVLKHYLYHEDILRGTEKNKMVQLGRGFYLISNLVWLPVSTGESFESLSRPTQLGLFLKEPLRPYWSKTNICKLVPTCCGERWRRPATLQLVTIAPNTMPLESVLSELTFMLYYNFSSLVAALALNVKTHSRQIRGLKKTRPINQADNCYGSHYPLLTSAICLNGFIMPRAVSTFSTTQLGRTSSHWLSLLRKIPIWLSQGVFDL